MRIQVNMEQTALLPQHWERTDWREASWHQWLKLTGRLHPGQWGETAMGHIFLAGDTLTSDSTTRTSSIVVKKMGRTSSRQIRSKKDH